MPTPQETAYPTLKTQISKKTLDRVYAPSADEISFAKKHSRTLQNRVCILTLLKCAQRLGYFVVLSAIPRSIPEYIAKQVGCRCSLKMLRLYDDGRTRTYHIKNIRSFLNIKPPDKDARSTALKTMEHSAYTKEDIVDILNVGIEELIRLRYELPKFDHLIRLAYQARKTTNASIYTTVNDAILESTRNQLEKLLTVAPETNRSLWDQLRQDPGKVTIKEIDKAIERLLWIRSLDFPFDPFSSIPYAKFRHFAMEAKSFNANRIGAVVQPKRSVLMAAMIKSALARNIDDIMIMIVKKAGKIQRAGKIRLDEYLETNRDNTDRIVTSYMSIHEHAFDDTEMDSEQKLAAIQRILNQSPELVDFSAQHTVYGSKNYCRFLWPLFRGSRAAFFKALKQLEFVSSSSDQALLQAIAFARAHHRSRSQWISREAIDPDTGQTITMEDLSWIPDKWWYLVTGQKRRQKVPEKIDRHQFEVCLFFELINELKCADMCIVGSEDFSDPTDQLVSMEELWKKLPRYAEVVGLPIDTVGFIAYTKTHLNTQAQKHEAAYPNNMEFSVKPNGDLWLARLKAKDTVPGVDELTEMIKYRMPQRNILDIIVNTLKTLNWCKSFGPISGFESKIKDPLMSYAVATFCYGCNLGPMQTERSLPVLSRKHLEWINRRHITEEKLEKAINVLVNGYNRFLLPTYWGTGETASADGTRWDVYENNLVSEYHVRYGSYCGIGYYHVSDKNIALFSRFIPCGVYEASFILDPFFPNKSDIKPHTGYGDTHAQSLTVFGLAYLLGIQLMPRIARWKDLKIYKFPGESYPNIESMFTVEEIDEGLIAKYLVDMQRVAVSILEGRISPSFILRKLTSGTRKNKLYYAFQELGKVVRSAYLLKYLRKPELRRTVNNATTGSERFNDFIQFVTFGNRGTIAANSRDEQRKIIKYGHLVANILIFMNVHDQSKIMSELIQEGHVITKEQAACLAPYRKANTNRFGAYFLDELRDSIPIDYRLPVVSLSN
jgi:TnpA family transposase